MIARKNAKNRKTFLLFVLVIGMFYKGISQDKRPNILFIFTDDQAYWTLSKTGNPNAHTPNIDKLASEGAFFTNAFVTTPVCSPSRASIMTSQYASEYNILDFIPQPGHKLYDEKENPGLDPASITYPEALQKSGYTTGLIGKWHLGDWVVAPDKKYHPTNNGFDYFMGITGGGESPIDPKLEENGKVQTFKGLTTDIFTDRALRYITEHSGDEKPFLLCLNYRAPHGRFLPVAESDWEPYENLDPVIPNPNYPDLDIEKVKQKMKEYLASCTGVDRSVGRITDLLHTLGIDENTIIIYSSDHGYNMGHNGIEHKGNGYWITKSAPAATQYISERSRPNLYDNSLRVPAIVKWPGVVKAGTVIDHTISNLDWYPTILNMAGAKADPKQVIRGRDLKEILQGQDPEGWNEDMYSEYSQIHYSTAYMRSYRTPEWKLIRDFRDSSRDELYNIALDPEENINMIHDSRQSVKDVIADLHGKIIGHMKMINDPLLKEMKLK